MFRTLVNKLYGRERGLDARIDAAVPSTYIAGELLRRILQKTNAICHLYPTLYIGAGSRIRCRSNLKVGNSTVFGRAVTVDALSQQGIQIGKNCTIDDYATLKGSGVIRNIGVGVKIGDRTAIGARNTILGQGGVSIGDDCLLGPNVTIVSENHNFGRIDRTIREQGETRARIVVGNDVWIGAGATVLAGSVIGDGAVIAAGAIVRGIVDSNTIVGGVPARVIGQRRSNANI